MGSAMDAAPGASDNVRERYARFARDEAPGRSPLYAQWASGVAGDARLAALLGRIPADHRQPPLVFAVTRMLGAPLGPYREWAEWVAAHADAVTAACAARGVQTNEPLRCAALLPALSIVEGPIALLEVGASAGLCLYPDRYSYRYAGKSGLLTLDPPGGPATVVLEAELRGDAVPPLRLPEIVWRAGIDLRPLDAGDDGDRAWLRGLVWPGETGREERIVGALDLVAADPPLLVAGDAVDLLGAVAAQAPEGATLVVTTPGVLAHVPHGRRAELIAAVRALPGHWITLDHPALHAGWTVPIDRASWPAGAFALARDGGVIAAADPIGRWLEWRAGDAASAHSMRE